MLPTDLDGSALPPGGAPNYYVGLADSTHLNFFRCRVDFNKPSNSSFLGPTLVSVAPYSEICARDPCVLHPAAAAGGESGRTGGPRDVPACLPQLRRPKNLHEARK
ncbi:MAG: hypothetical protein DMG49_12305 [Acidobacteria bacterium]|nr:MAG: hypothetical protein DMG49_12305 [Acidobacteriota bacterium]